MWKATRTCRGYTKTGRRCKRKFVTADKPAFCRQHQAQFGQYEAHPWVWINDWRREPINRRTG